MLTDNQAADLTRNDHFFKFWMPYLFQSIKLPGHKWAFIPLNRNYKPLGQLSKERVDYDAHADSHGVIFKKNPFLLEGIWVHKHLEDEGDMRLWLYEDALHTRKSYFERMAKLMKLAMPFVGQKKAS